MVNEKLSYFVNVRLRQLPFFYKRYRSNTIQRKEIRIIGIIRERNEELLLKDTLDHLSGIVDAIVVFDDASTDHSVEIARSHPAVVEVVCNRRWRKKNRAWEETANRKKLHDVALSYDPEWIFYSDADERFEGDIRGYLLSECPSEVRGVRVSLFDAYMTKSDKQPYKQGVKLYDFRQFFGIERRDILMAWRNIKGVDFRVMDAREPQGIPEKAKVVKFYCQHYGKALSEEQWEETCRYYMEFFPKYSEKWKKRQGKAIHDKSDFNTPLKRWDEVKQKSVRI